MSKINIIRAWKDEKYRRNLSAEELCLLPEHPSGSIQLTDDELFIVAGSTTETNNSSGCCSGQVSLCGTCGSASRGCCVKLLL